MCVGVGLKEALPFGVAAVSAAVAFARAVNSEGAARRPPPLACPNFRPAGKPPCRPQLPHAPDPNPPGMYAREEDTGLFFLR